MPLAWGRAVPPDALRGACRAVTARTDRHNPRAGPILRARLRPKRALVGADEAAGGGPHAFRSQRLRQLLGPRSRDLKGDRERRLMGPQGRKHVYRMHHCEPLSAVL